MDGKTWPRGFHSDAFPHGAVSSRSPAPNSREVLVMYRKRESAKEYEEREMLRRAFDTST